MWQWSSFFVTFTIGLMNGWLRKEYGYRTIETYSRREKRLKLREELLAAEEDRMTESTGCTPDEPDAYLDKVMGSE